MPPLFFLYLQLPRVLFILSVLHHLTMRCKQIARCVYFSIYVCTNDVDRHAFILRSPGVVVPVCSIVFRVEPCYHRACVNCAANIAEAAYDTAVVELQSGATT